MLCMLRRLTEPSSGASTPDLDPYSPVDRKRALRGCTFVPDIQEIRVRSDHTHDTSSWVTVVKVNMSMHLFMKDRSRVSFLLLYFFHRLQPDCLKERLPALPGTPYQWLGEALCGGAPALRLPVPQWERQCGESSHQPVICKGGIQWRQTNLAAGKGSVKKKIRFLDK